MKSPEEEVKNLNVSVDGYIPDDYVESDYEKLDISTHIIGDCKKSKSCFDAFRDAYYAVLDINK